MKHLQWHCKHTGLPTLLCRLYEIATTPARVMLQFFFSLVFCILGEIKTLFHILFSPIKGDTHKARLESFYKGQAFSYDAYRKRLLHGREELFASLVAELRLTKDNKTQKKLVWVDLGAGTGSNLELMEQAAGGLDHFEAIYLVDLSGSLLKVAKKRIEEHRWKNVTCVEADATTFVLPDGAKADLVTFSYSLTMIPDWFSVLENVRFNLLKTKDDELVEEPTEGLKVKEVVTTSGRGGVLGAVDFYVSRRYPSHGLTKQHSWFVRTFWPVFFAQDNVHLNRDHLPYLCSKFRVRSVTESFGGVPYIPLLKVPHYRFVGRNSD
ncbi:Betaine lipid synthase [Balamuthia mandrillaris]